MKFTECMIPLMEMSLNACVDDLRTNKVSFSYPKHTELIKQTHFIDSAHESQILTALVIN